MTQEDHPSLPPTSPGLVTQTGEPLLVLPREVSQLPPPATLVGQKAHGLARLLAVKARVPRFGVITASAFDSAIALPDIQNLLARARTQNLEDEATRAAWSERLVHAVSNAPLPPAVEHAVNMLLEAFRDDEHVAVRASSVGAQAETSILSGAFETFLFLKGKPLIVEAVRQCMANAFALKVLSARHDAGIDVLGTRLAVIVQRMVNAEVSGSCRTVELNTQPGENPNVEIVATFGVGGGGSLTSQSSRLRHDMVRVARPVMAEDGLIDDAPIEEQRAAKSEALRLDDEHGRGTRLVTLIEDEQDAPALAAREARLVAQEALRLEAALGDAQALEFALAGRLLYLLQAQPILSASDRIESTRVRSWDLTLIPEGMRGLTTPLSFGLFQATFIPAFGRSMELLGGALSALDERRPVRGRLLGLLGGRVYVNVSAVKSFLDLLPDGALVGDGLARSLGMSALAPSTDLPSPDDDAVRINRMLKIGRRQHQAAEEHLDEVRHSVSRLGVESLDDKDPDGLIDVLDLALGFSREAETQRLTTQIAAAACFGVLERMAQAWVPDLPEGMVLDLFAGEPGLATDAIYEGAFELARAVERDRVLTEIFAQESSGSSLFDRLDGLPSAESFLKHLEEVSHRGSGRLVSERKAEFPSLDERSDLLLELVKAVLDDSRDLDAMASRTAGLRKKAEYVVFKDLSDKRVLLGLGSRRKLVERALEETRRGLCVQEGYRELMARLTGVLRRVVLATGQRLFEHGLLHHPLDVFYLALDELRGLVRGTAFDPDPRPVVGARKRHSRRFPQELPPTFDTVGVLATADLDSLVTPQPNTDPQMPRFALKAEGAASGEVTGRVQTAVSHMGTGTSRLRALRAFAAGGITLTAEPDPGLVPRLALSEAVVFGMGARLSPTVVKLRAMGIPTVVGPLHVQRIFEDGERLLVDGRTGTVKHVDDGRTNEPRSPRYDPDAFTRLAAPTDPQRSALAPPPPLTDEEFED